MTWLESKVGLHLRFAKEGIILYRTRFIKLIFIYVVGEKSSFSLSLIIAWSFFFADAWGQQENDFTKSLTRWRAA